MNKSYDALRNRIEIVIQTRLGEFLAQWAKNLEDLHASQHVQIESYKVVHNSLESHMATVRGQRQERFEQLHLAELDSFFDGNPDLPAVEEFGKNWLQAGRVFYADLRAVLDADYQALSQLSDAFYNMLRSQHDQFNSQFSSAYSEVCTEIAGQILQMVNA